MLRSLCVVVLFVCIVTEGVSQSQNLSFGPLTQALTREDYASAIEEISVLIGERKIPGLIALRAQLYSGTGDFSSAISDLDELIEMIDSAAYRLQRGYTFRQMGYFQKAIDDYSAAIRINPADLSVYFFRGFANDQLGNLSEALSDYTVSIVFNPLDAQTYYNRGVVYKRIGGNLKLAIDDYTTAIELSPNNAKFWNSRGNAKTELKDYSGAEADYRKAISLDPKLSDPWMNLAIIFSEQSRFTDALEAAGKSVMLAPTNVSAIYQKAVSLYRVKMFREAKIEIDRARALDPNHSNSLDLLPEIVKEIH